MTIKQNLSLLFVLLLGATSAWAQDSSAVGKSATDYSSITVVPFQLKTPTPTSNWYTGRNVGSNLGTDIGNLSLLSTDPNVLLGITKPTFDPNNVACYSLTTCYSPLPYYGSIQKRNTAIKKGISNIFDDYCPVAVKETSIDKVAKATDVVACYKDRNVSHPQMTEFQKFQEDRAVCDCLKKIGGTVTEVGSIMNMDVNEIQQIKVGDVAPENLSENERMLNFETNVSETRRQMNQNSNGMAFQASVLADLAGKPVKDDQVDSFAKVYATDPMGRSIGGGNDGEKRRGLHLFGRKMDIRVAQFAGTYFGNVESGQLNEIDGMLNIRNRDGRKQSTGEKEKQSRLDLAMNNLSQPGGAVKELLQPVDIKRPQCVSAREFMAFKQIPDALTAKELHTDSGDINGWNYKVLKKEWKDLMAGSYAEKQANKQKIISIRSRVMFLERNPMIKNFLGAESSDLKDFFSAMPNQNEEVITAAYANDLDGRKKALLGYLKNAIPDSSCKTSECMISSPQLKENLNKILEFFSRPENAQVTRTENNKTNADIANRLIASGKKMFAPKPTSMSREGVDKSFKAYGLGSPSTCDEKYVVDMCVRTYAGYCHFLDENKNEIDNLGDQDPLLADDLEMKTANLFETDPEKNPEFKDFIKSACDTPRRKDITDRTGKYQTFWQYFDSQCKSDCDKPATIQKIRAEYLAANPEPAVPGTGVDSTQIAAFNKLMIGSPNVGKGASDQTVAAVSSGGSSTADINSLLREANESFGFEGNMDRTSVAKSDKSSAFDPAATNGTASAKVDNKIDNTPQFDDASMIPNYSMANAGANAAANNLANNQPQKIENMSDPQRQELMDDWQKEYDAWKKNKNENDGSPVANATDAAMQARIQALEQLLAQQKKLTDDQYKLLNDALANQNRVVNNAVAANDGNSSSSSSSNGRNRSTSAISGSSDEDDSNVSRGPASIANQPQSTSGSKGGAGSAGVGSGGSTSSRRVSVGGSNDDIAREEAKLVNVRGNSDGSIVISSVSNSSGSGANAISVPVSDDQYRALQANPQSLNLSQIEKNIPKDQIAKLEKDGEIVILLRNGSNPPFEVKVEKKNNKLVYSLKDKNGKDQAPVRRVFTRQALELQLKANR